MKSRQRKVIILKNLNSPNFEQALFVLKDSCEDGQSAVFEAEKIIEEYIFPSITYEDPPSSKKAELLPFAITGAVAVAAGIAAVLANIL